jgi:aminomethyltransferase
LYGNDIDETTDPLEAGLGWTVKFSKEDFIGRDALVKRKEGGLSRKFVGLELNAKRIARTGYAIHAAGDEVGLVTSGAFAPHLEKSLAMGYLKTDLAVPGTAVEIDVRGRMIEASVVKIPFLKTTTG